MRLLYRGPLSSCNYACPYCPFAKRRNTRAELREDERALRRFAAWFPDPTWEVLFTPWGEALVQRYYREVLSELSWRARRVAVQTNLSRVDGLEGARRESLALWATYHPGEVSGERFLARCQELDGLGLRYSVGVVGLREHFGAVEWLRERLRPEVYLWVNAYKREAGYYSEGEVARLEAVDPYFGWNLRRYASQGRACRAGESTFTVDGKGDARRCHFVPEVIGNIYDGSLDLRARPCPAATCGCHIGYIHRPELELEELYGAGMLERIPASWPTVDGRYASTT